MTRTAIRHTMFALATTSLLIAFTGLTAHAQFESQINSMMNNNSAQGIHDSNPIESFKINTPKGRATHYPTRWFQDDSGGASSHRSNRIPSMMGVFVPAAGM